MTHCAQISLNCIMAVISGGRRISFCTCCGDRIPPGSLIYSIIKQTSGRSAGMWCDACYSGWCQTGRPPKRRFLVCGHTTAYSVQRTAEYVSFRCVRCGRLSYHAPARLRTKWMRKRLAANPAANFSLFARTEV